jgi:hypothetical protein
MNRHDAELLYISIILFLFLAMAFKCCTVVNRDSQSPVDDIESGSEGDESLYTGSDVSEPLPAYSPRSLLEKSWEIDEERGEIVPWA